MKIKVRKPLRHRRVPVAAALKLAGRRLPGKLRRPGRPHRPAPLPLIPLLLMPLRMRAHRPLPLPAGRLPKKAGRRGLKRRRAF